MRWEDDVLEDIRSMHVCTWKKVAQDRDSWKKAVEQARTLHRQQRFVRRRSVYLRTNNDLCHLHHKLIGFYNRDEKCLQRGTDWVFK